MPTSIEAVLTDVRNLRDEVERCASARLTALLCDPDTTRLVDDEAQALWIAELAFVRRVLALVDCDRALDDVRALAHRSLKREQAVTEGVASVREALDRP